MKKNWTDYFIFSMNGFVSYAMLYIACDNLIGTGRSPFLGWVALVTFVLLVAVIVWTCNARAKLDSRSHKLLNEVMELNKRILDSNQKLIENNDGLIQDNVRLVDLNKNLLGRDGVAPHAPSH